MEAMKASQRGATPIMMLIWLLILVSVGTLAVKIIPVYLDDMAVKGALDGIKSDSQLADYTDSEIMASLGRFFSINNVRGFDTENNVFIEREDDGGVTVRVKYEVRTPIVHNIDTVVSFDHAHTAPPVDP